jgi:ribosome biogenesis protein Nip4
MKTIMNFAIKFGANIVLNKDFIFRKGDRYFLLNRSLSKLVRDDFYYAGVYLGKLKSRKFSPSFYLLALIAKNNGKAVVVDHKTSWLFICGRDIFRKGIVSTHGLSGKNNYTLVLNEFGECLGFGKTIKNLDAVSKGTDIIIRNILDIGDFLRRED